MIQFGPLPFGETITLIRRTIKRNSQNAMVRDDYGMPQYEDSETEVPGCVITTAGAAGQPFSQELSTSQVATRMQLQMPSYVELDPDDRVRARGVLFEVDGELGPSMSPFSGRCGPTAVFLKRVTG